MANQTPEEKAAADKATKDEQAAQAKLEKDARDAKQAEEKAAADRAEELKTLIRLVKDGSELYVHPSCVKSHNEVGWVTG